MIMTTMIAMTPATKYVAKSELVTFEELPLLVGVGDVAGALITVAAVVAYEESISVCSCKISLISHNHLRLMAST